MGIGRLHPTDHGVGGALWFGAAAAHMLNDADSAAELNVLLDRQIHVAGPPGPCVSFAHSRGRLAVVTGRHADAIHAFAEARSDYRASGHRTLTALVDADEAALDGPNREALCARADAAFEELGMTGWRQRLARQSADRSTPSASRTVGGLSHRETEVLRLVASGLTNNEIAGRLILSQATVNRHIANVYLKLGTRNRSEATSWAHANGLMTT